MLRAIKHPTRTVSALRTPLGRLRRPPGVELSVETPPCRSKHRCIVLLYRCTTMKETPMPSSIRTLLAVAAAASLLVAVPAWAQAPAKKLIRIHTAGPDDLGVDNTMLAHQFMTYVNANSPSVEVKVFPNSQLGQSREVIEAMRLGGGATGTTGGPAEYASFVKRIGVLGLPFVGKSYDHAAAVLDGPVGKELNADMEKAGFKVLSWAVSWGYRNVVTAKKEVKQPSDLKGLKIRTIPTKVFVSAINAMGANATPMNFGEIYTSLQSGVLDGYEHTAATTISFKFNEVACCIAMTRHLMDPTVLVFSLAEWRKFSPAEQAVLQKGADAAAAKVRQMAPEREAEALAKVKALGMKVHEFDLAPLQKAALTAQDELAKEFGAESLLKQIRAQ
jgi:TRAP-type transport system periplasmic protein